VNGQQLRGYVGWGDMDSYGVVLERDTPYMFHVVADDPEVDFDLYVVDENEHVVDADESLESDATCQVVPRWTGPFSIVVRAVSGGGGYTLIVQE